MQNYKRIKINDRYVGGEDDPVFVIAEAGVNHQCRMDLAREMVIKAAEAGADAIKFQTYKAEKLSTKTAPIYWNDPNETAKTQYEAFKASDKFGKNEYVELFRLCEDKGIIFLSTPFDEQSADFLNELGVPAFKIASFDLTNHPLLRHVARFGKPIILSTGASYLEEIKEAVEVITKEGNDQIIILHCILSYPTKDEDANLLMITTLKKEFPDFIIGYSDHTIPDPCVTVPIVAASLGAKVIEKHYTLDKTWLKDDHFFSVNPIDLKNMVTALKIVPKSFGNQVIDRPESELGSRVYGRRSIVSKVFLPKGKVVSEDSLICKRPGTGIEPKFMNKIVGRQTLRSIPEDEVLEWGDFYNIVCIIQARMGSERLPGKSLVDINGKPLLQILVERLKKAKSVSSIVIATSEKKIDDPIVDFANKFGIQFFRGSEDDVLERFLGCARENHADYVVRVCGDSPLVDPHYVDDLIKKHVSFDKDFSYSESYKGLVDGMGCEILSMNILEKLGRIASEKKHREHVTLYMRENPKDFDILSLEVSLQRPDYRVCIDTEEDLKLVRQITKVIPNPSFGDVINYLDNNPELVKINSAVEQKYGALLKQHTTKRILLVVPPFYRLMGSHCNSVPLGVCYVASVLRNEGFHVRVYNADYADNMDYISQREVFENYDLYKEILYDINHPVWQGIKKDIEGFSPDVVGLSMLTATYKSCDNLARLVKEINPHIPVVVGGVHPTLLPGETLKNDRYDFVIFGEGEFTFSDFLKGKELSSINGLAYKKGGKVVVNPPREFVKNLDNLPFPARDLFLKKDENIEYGSIITGRGCPHQCTYCASKKIWGQRTRFRSVDNVFAELKEIVTKYKTSVINFRDDTFTIDVKRAKEICRRIIESELKIEWVCDTRVDSLDLELLELMKKAGCKRIRIGVESGSERILKNIKKGITKDRIRQAVGLIRKAGIDFTTYLMVGFPDETDEDVRETIAFAKELDPKYYSLSVVSPYYGTEMYDAFIKAGRSVPKEHWEYFFHQSKDMILTNKISEETILEFLSLNETQGKKRLI